MPEGGSNGPAIIVVVPFASTSVLLTAKGNYPVTSKL
jgi:hypothetical protein